MVRSYFHPSEPLTSAVCQIHLGRELSHLLKSMSSREAEFSLLRSWRCKFLHLQPPHSCSERAEHQRSDVILSDMFTGQEPVSPHWTGRALACSFAPRLQQGGVSSSVAGNVLDSAALYRIMESLEGICGEHQVQLHPVKWGLPRVDSQGHVKLSYEYLQEWRLHILPGWPTPVFDHLHN